MSTHASKISMEKIVSLAKRRGFIFPGSEIYGGLSGTWDYGPLGVELKNNIKREFWRTLVYQRDDTVGLDAAVLMNPRVWEASGHTEAFADPLIECKVCHERIRADNQEDKESHEKTHRTRKETPAWTEPRQFNLLMAAELGSVEGKKSSVYLRGEITQGVHVNFKNVLDAAWMKIPFGIVQIGKAFRNEITPGNFTFRSREFEQMELQYYVRPHEAESMRWFLYWKEERMAWYKRLGIRGANLRFREHAPDERAHYARAAWDIEYNSPFGGWKECEGIHHRGEWDLSRHKEFSGVDLSYFDEEAKERFIPWVIETSGGVDRALLFFLIDAYREEPDKDGVRTLLKIHPQLAPYKVAVFPLLANKPDLVDRARKIYTILKSSLVAAWDDIGNIGKRYRRQDEIGTPFCITVDFETLEDGTVTVRDRDTMRQERVNEKELIEHLSDKIKTGS
ncbi:MAG: glycine--tRNA ligase [Candidatus Sungbacteria bacterium]|uniref:Glycine--tRNA ligase n=1 Tax=Candidatus Sungiibacteriota bacterium TaxID=2750080 RepID=A0A931SEA5_9BACT|nr:glycine--tRNA ligase [Candidatus Sungbacteria bacterium]